MNISAKEGSEYFRGLLLLISKDRVLSEPEIVLMRRVGKSLGFNQEFIDEAIDSILENPHVPTSPPNFSSEELAKRFLRDGLAIARSDNGLHMFEVEWLQAVAERNNVDLGWFRKQKDQILHVPPGTRTPLEADDLRIGTE